tara:strand:+ start:27580 stop:29169 length:1590 start_codon:yes stop_codon:yes gene_type:complete
MLRNYITLAQQQSELQFDADATAFIDAVGTLTAIETEAVNQFVIDLKAGGVWAKKDAIYPLLGNTATSHKWNLKDPRDLDAAFRITWVGALTHGGGYIENTLGTLGNYADTHLIPANLNTLMTTNDIGISFWKSAHVGGGNYTEMGTEDGDTRPRIQLQTGWGANLDFDNYWYSGGERATFLPSNYIGLMSGNRIGTALKAFKDGVLGNSVVNDPPQNDHTILVKPMYFMGHSRNATTGNVSAPTVGQQYRAFTLGGGLTDAETLAEYNAWKDLLFKADYDAQAFVSAVGTLTASEELAVYNLIAGLKENGTWNKYIAIYPFIGGTAAEHKWNLKDPRDLDVAFRLTFNGAITHDANGVTLGGVSTSFIDTHLIPNTEMALNDFNVGMYSKTLEGIGIDFSAEAAYPHRISMFVRWNGTSEFDGHNDGTSRITYSTVNTQGYFNQTRVSGTDHRAFRDGVQISTTQTGTSGTTLSTDSFYIGKYRRSDNGLYSNKNYAFCVIGKGLTPEESLNDSNVIAAFQTELSRAN